MNKELQERLMSYLETLEGAVDQAPMYVQEIVRWQIAEGIIWCVLSLGITLVLLVFNFTKLRSMRRDEEEETASTGWTLGVIVVVLMFCSIAVVGASASYSLKAYVAPRVVIVEQLQKVIR